MRSRHVCWFFILIAVIFTAPASARDALVVTEDPSHYKRSFEALLEQADSAIADERWADARDILQKAAVLAPDPSLIMPIREVVEDKCTEAASRLADDAQQSLQEGNEDLAEWSCRQALRHASSRHPARAQCQSLLSGLVLERAYHELSRDNLRAARRILQSVDDPSDDARSLLREVDDKCLDIAAEYLSDARRAWLEDNSRAACTYCRLGLSFASERQNRDDVGFCQELRRNCK